MNIKCRTIISKMLLEGNKGDKQISQTLLDWENGENTKLEKITQFAKLMDISPSSFSRYIKKSGFPSFKHFSYDFNESSKVDENKSQEAKIEDTYLSDYYTTAKRVSSTIKEGKIYIISSKRGKSIGKLMNERLNDGNFDNKLYHETTDNLEEFVSEIQGETLFLISLSGHSKVISETLSLISEIDGKKPKIIILTAGKWMNMFENSDFISIGKIKNRDYKIDDWKNYNLCLLDILTLVILIINTLTLKREGKNG